MDSGEYQRLTKASQDLSDEFYRQVHTCLTSNDMVVMKTCLDLGRQYTTALKSVIDFLSALPLTERRKQALENCEKLEATLSAMMVVLQNKSDRT